MTDKLKTLPALRPLLAVFVLNLILLILWLATFIFTPRILPTVARYEYWRESLLFIPVYSVVGYWIASQKTNHRIGWLFLLSALMGNFQAVTGSVANYGFSFSQTGWYYWASVAALASQLFQFMVNSSLILLICLFPTGYLLSKRWQWLGWTVGISMGLFLTISTFMPQNLQDYPIKNPLGVVSLTPFLRWLENIAGPIYFLGIGGAFLMQIFRFFKGSYQERQQLKWFVFASLFYIALLSGIPLFPNNPLNSWYWGLIPTGLPVAVGIAILRYKLYDIDLIIRRTLQYSLLTGLLVLVYFGAVTVLQSVFTAFSGQQSAASLVLSTLAIAALFNPLRKRIQDFIDRRFYRQKYDAEKALSAFAEAARRETELESLTTRLTATVQETLQPESIALWIRPDLMAHKPDFSGQGH